MNKFTEKVKKIFSGRRTFGLACAISFITISGAAIIYAAPSNGYDPAQAIADGGWTSTVTGTHYNSYGKINYSDGTNSVVADAADIATIDEMVGNGKKNIKNAIKSVDADDRLGTSSWDESTYPDFESMANMIVASQSLSETQTGTQAVNNKGEALYYKDQTASDTKDLTQTCTDNTGFPVYYQPATAANLTAGSAAFIDGQLILGTGADNDTYLDKGIEYFSDPFIVLTGPNQSYTATSYCYYKIAVGSIIGYCGGEVYVNGVKVAEHPYNSSGMTYKNGYLNAGDTISTRNDSSPYRVELYHR